MLVFMVLTFYPDLKQYEYKRSKLFCKSSGVLPTMAISSAKGNKIKTISSINYVEFKLSCKYNSRSSSKRENINDEITSP
jgi:hypothetical protein